MSAAGFAGVVLTLGFYAAARVLGVRFPMPLTNPVVVAVPPIVAVLFALDIRYADYMGGAAWVAELLAPATVALGLPVYRHRAVLRRYAVAALAGLAAGGSGAIVAAVVLAQALGLAASLYPGLAIKSATAPIAVQLGVLLAAEPALCAVLAIATGMTGALLGPWVLNACAVRDPVARGLAYGGISHGIGTAQALAEGELQGAVSGVAMGCGAIFVSVAAPRLLPLLV